MGNGSLWNEISYGDKVPDEFIAVIETPMGSRNKFEANKDGPGIVLDRVLYSSVSYPETGTSHFTGCGVSHHCRRCREYQCS